MPHGMWDLSPLTRDQIHAPLLWKPRVLAIGLPGKSLNPFPVCMFEIHQISLDPRPLGCKIYIKSRFPGSTSGKEPACQCRRHKRCRFDPWVGKIPWIGKWQPIPVFLPGKSRGQRTLADFSPWVRKELDMTEQKKKKKNFKTWKRIQMLFLLSYLFSRKPWKIHSSWHYLGVSQPSYSVPTNLGLRSLQCAACRGSLILLHIWLCPRLAARPVTIRATTIKIHWALFTRNRTHHFTCIILHNRHNKPL